MKLISNKKQLIDNIETLESIFVNGKKDEKEEATSLVKRGTCFIAYKVGTTTHFAPSRFIGYQDNKLKSHSKSTNKDGRETNKAINKILGVEPYYNEKFEEEYIQYCIHLGIKPNSTGSFGAGRKYWNLDIKNV